MIMEKLINLILLVRTVRNFWVVLLEHLGIRQIKFLKLSLRSNQLIIIRSGTTDYHEVISVLSGREYPVHFLNFDSQKPVIVNVGAHIGTFDLFIKNLFPSSKLISIEPNLANFDLLKKNIKINNLHDIETLNLALSNKNGKCSLFFSENQLNTGNLFRGTKESKIRCMTLDRVVHKFLDKKIDLLKMDCEGCEYLTLTKISKNIQINNIFLEYHNISKTYNILKLMKSLEMDYDVKYRRENKNLRTGVILLVKKS